jgi:hypothetical protein
MLPPSPNPIRFGDISLPQRYVRDLCDSMMTIQNTVVFKQQQGLEVAEQFLEGLQTMRSNPQQDSLHRFLARKQLIEEFKDDMLNQKTILSRLQERDEARSEAAVRQIDILWATPNIEPEEKLWPLIHAEYQHPELVLAVCQAVDKHFTQWRLDLAAQYQEFLNRKHGQPMSWGEQLLANLRRLI